MSDERTERLALLWRFAAVNLLAIALVGFATYSFDPAHWGVEGRLLLGLIAGWSLANLVRKWNRLG